MRFSLATAALGVAVAYDVAAVSRARRLMRRAMRRAALLAHRGSCARGGAKPTRRRATQGGGGFGGRQRASLRRYCSTPRRPGLGSGRGGGGECVCDVRLGGRAGARVHVFGHACGCAQTPPLGWNSWNHFNCGVDADVLQAQVGVAGGRLRVLRCATGACERPAQALAMNTTGLQAAGYMYVNSVSGGGRRGRVPPCRHSAAAAAIVRATGRLLDAGGPERERVSGGWAPRASWVDGGRDARTHERVGAQVPNPAKFPNGFAAVTAYIHSLGLKSGLYTARGPHTCAGFAASCGHEAQDALLYASWLIDYVKDDACSSWCVCRVGSGRVGWGRSACVGGGGHGALASVRHVCARSSDYLTDYGHMQAGIWAAGRPMVLSVEGDPPVQASARRHSRDRSVAPHTRHVVPRPQVITNGGYGNMKRVGHDIQVRAARVV
jgi:hypothetical protein